MQPRDWSMMYLFGGSKVGPCILDKEVLSQTFSLVPTNKTRCMCCEG